MDVFGSSEKNPQDILKIFFAANRYYTRNDIETCVAKFIFQYIYTCTSINGCVYNSLWYYGAYTVSWIK